MYVHHKGGRYILYGASVKEDTLELLVHYYSCEKKTRWTRTAENFFDDMESAKDVYRPRFEFKARASWQELAEAAGFDRLAEGLEALGRGQHFASNVFVPTTTLAR